jgi:Zn-dependent protease
VEEATLDQVPRTPESTPATGPSPQDAEALDELDRLQNQRPSWAGAIAVLVLSLVLYMAAAQTQEFWGSLVFLLAVLTLHESGHYVAMRVFGYRNVRMFFIPFFGAAVSGQHYNIAGWKKAVVALAGPVPGILLAVPLGAVGFGLESPTMVDLCQLLLILNGFNLLPFLPLDGGWVVHAILFVRHPVLDLIFRIGAGLCILGLALLTGTWCLGAMGLFALLAAPATFRLSRIAYRLGQEGLVTRSPDSQSIPAEAALQILAELRPALPPQTSAKILAQHVVNVFETFNAEPPGALATFGLLALHVGTFALAVAASVVLSVLKQPG